VCKFESMNMPINVCTCVGARDYVRMRECASKCVLEYVCVGCIVRRVAQLNVLDLLIAASGTQVNVHMIYQCT